MEENKIGEFYIQVIVRCDPDAAEALSNFLFELSANGVEEQDMSVIGYFNGKMDPELLQKNLSQYIRELHKLGFSAEDAQLLKLPVEDWSEGWRAYFHPISVTDNIIIKPPWESWNGFENIIIDIMPRMAFGTGSHETTQLCLTFLEKIAQPGDLVLDIGTGSGILAIAAAKLGAKCVAVEIDEDAIDNTHENVIMNHVDSNVQIIQGGIDVIPKQKYDIILANINRKVLIDMIPELAPFCHKQTQLILSGILISEKELIIRKAEECGLSICESRTQGEWIGFRINKK